MNKQFNLFVAKVIIFINFNEKLDHRIIIFILFVNVESK